MVKHTNIGTAKPKAKIERRESELMAKPKGVLFLVNNKTPFGLAMVE